MTIIRVGLAETKNYASGYDAIFGKKKVAAAGKPAKKSSQGAARKKKPGRKK